VLGQVPVILTQVSQQRPVYHTGPARRLLNRLMTTLILWGVAPPHTYLLTTVGRRTGVPRTNPVTLVENAQGRWLVAPYGPVSWVHNARSAGRVTLRRGRHTQECAVAELGPQDAAPVLKAYVRQVAIVRPFFGLTPESSLEDFATEAPRHPVFRLGAPS
jgi:deazaflavin-dependent oxidoreductase (nitroreductase family)